MSRSAIRTAEPVTARSGLFDITMESLNRLEPVTLDDLVSTADLQTRKDRKYLVPIELLPTVVEAVGGLQVLTIDGRRRFGYRSTYFDTPTLDSYLAAARRRPRRYKIRTRHYVDSDLCRLEVKTRDRRGRTVKQRIDCFPDEALGLSAGARSFVASIDETSQVAQIVAPTLTGSYHRSTLLVGAPSPAAEGAEPARVTIDTAVVWRATSGAIRSLGPLALVETKTTGRPCPFDHSLWSNGHRPVTISKYGTGLAALHPGLPSNKWNRVLRRHLGGRRGAR